MRYAALFLLTAALPSLHGEEWVRISTPQFKLYTAAGEKKGRETIQQFEQVRAFFLKASPVHGSTDSPVRIIQFETAEQYNPYRPHAFSGAYFASQPWGDYIVLGNAATSSMAIHEYMHLIVRHSGLKLPTWLNEGWADVYSSLRPSGKGTAVGDLLQDRLDILMRDPWLSFQDLTATDSKSPNYNEASRAGIFYAESWALAHMLYLSPEYSPNFGKFVTALNRGASSAEACQMAFGRSADEVFQDLKNYFNRRKILGRVFEVEVDAADRTPEVSPLSKFDARLVLAEVLVATNKLEEAQREYASLEMEQPSNAGVARGQGYASAAKGDSEGARRYFEKAFEEGETDPRMCLDMAVLENAAKQPPAKLLPILERALKSKPDYVEAKIELGLVKGAVRDYPGEISTLMSIPDINPEHAFAVFCGLSYARLQTGDSATARQNAEKCRQYAKTDTERQQAEQLVRRASETLQEISGTLRSLECLETGNKLHIAAGDKLLTFDVPRTETIETVRMPAGFAVKCGGLQPLPVTVQYAPARSAIEISTGTVRALIF
jgi:tetratricopeptide (TPR) repeat protein